jgi:hypothetical protein
MSGQPHDDDVLVGQLRRIAALADPVPDMLAQATRAAFGLRDLDARVAELVRDSAVDAPATAVRGFAPRLLSFETGDIAVECEVTTRESRRDLIGQIVGADVSLVDALVAGADVTGTDAAVSAGVDEHGRFSVRDLPAGLVQLRCRLADGTTVATSWAAI